MKKLFVFFIALSACLTTTAQQNILEAIRTTNSRIQTISCPFHEHQTMHSGKTKESDGRLYYVAPEQFALHFNDGDNIIINKTRIFLDHGMLHNKFSTKKNGLGHSLSTLMLYGFQGKCELLAEENGYTLSLTKEKDHYVSTFLIKRKKLLSFNTVKLYYRTDTYKLDKMYLVYSNGDIIIYTINNVKYDGKVDSDVFAF